jgi:phage pi2 protein 07
MEVNIMTTTGISSTNGSNQSVNQYLYDPSNESYTQMLSVNLNIPVPDGSVIISTVQLQELKKSQLRGVYWTMKDLEKKVNRKSEWIKENILYPTRFRKSLDATNGGFVFYPKSKGQTWSFQAAKMAEFLDDNFHRIFA